jgi:ATP-dependent RNA helicase RhlE
MNSFEDFKIKKTLLRAVVDLGFEKPSPIQQESYSAILSGS